MGSVGTSDVCVVVMECWGEGCWVVVVGGVAWVIGRG